MNTEGDSSPLSLRSQLDSRTLHTSSTDVDTNALRSRSHGGDSVTRDVSDNDSLRSEGSLARKTDVSDDDECVIVDEYQPSLNQSTSSTNTPLPPTPSPANLQSNDVCSRLRFVNQKTRV